MKQEGAFQGMRSRVAMPYNYGQSSSSTEVISLTSLGHLFQWSDDEKKVNGYTSSATISSVRIGLVLANMADNKNNDDLCHHMEAQE